MAAGVEPGPESQECGLAGTQSRMVGKAPLLSLPDSSRASDSSRTTARTPILYSPQHTPFSRKTHLPKQPPLKMTHSLPLVGLRYLKHSVHIRREPHPRSFKIVQTAVPWGFLAGKSACEARGSTPNTHSETHTGPKAVHTLVRTHQRRFHREKGFAHPLSTAQVHAHLCRYAPFCCYTPTFLSTYTLPSQKPLRSSHT